MPSKLRFLVIREEPFVLYAAFASEVDAGRYRDHLQKRGNPDVVVKEVPKDALTIIPT